MSGLDIDALKKSRLLIPPVLKPSYEEALAEAIRWAVKIAPLWRYPHRAAARPLVEELYQVFVALVEEQPLVGADTT